LNVLNYLGGMFRVYIEQGTLYHDVSISSHLY
jgi:hypothetical protein